MPHKLILILVCFLLFSCKNETTTVIVHLQKKDTISNSTQSKNEKTKSSYFFKDIEQNFSIEFPSKPKEQEREINSEFGHIKAKLYSTINEESKTAHIVAISKYKGVGNFSEKELNTFFNYRRDGAIENFNGRILLEEIVKFNDYPGRKYKILRNDNSITSIIWCYLIGENFYMLNAIVPREFDSSSFTYDFLNSFKLLTTPKPVSRNKDNHEFHEKKFGNDGCGEIWIPKAWKVQDEVWNQAITNTAGYSKSSKITILRANDYDNSTFYIKLSTKKLDAPFTKKEIHAPNTGFLEILNEDLEATINLLSKKNKIIDSNQSRFSDLGGASGGVFDYTYKISEFGQTRKTVIYTLIINSTFYNLTISWDIYDVKELDENLNSILSNIKLCDL